MKAQAMTEQMMFFTVNPSERKRERRTHVRKCVSNLSIFDLNLEAFKTTPVTRSKSVQDAKRCKRTVATRKWLVRTRYYENGDVRATEPWQMESPSEECGWTSVEGEGFYEWTDIFESEKTANRFLKDLAKDYKGQFAICA
jgi:hypothetical protein